MDQLISASLSHTQYWYEVGMLKVPANTPANDLPAVTALVPLAPAGDGRGVPIMRGAE